MPANRHAGARPASEISDYIGLLDAKPDARLRLFESIVTNANDAVLITDAEPLDSPGRLIVYANPAFTRMTGYRLEEVLGQSPRMLQGPLTGKEGAARLKAALKAWQRAEVEMLNYRKDGSTFWVQLSISPIGDENGFYTHWISVQRDITARKREETELRRNEVFLDRTGRLAGVGGFEFEIATGKQTWSPEMFRIHGLPPGALPPLEETTKYFAPAARPVISAAFAKCIAEGEAYDLELTFIRADGQPIWVRAMGALENEDGVPALLSGALQDITEQVTERVALRETSSRAAMAIESGGIGVWDWDIVNDVMVWDPWMYRLYGLRPEEDLWSAYELWRRHLHPDDRAAAELAIREGMAGNSPFDTEFRIRWGDGSVHHIRGTGRVTRDGAGRALRFVGANWDVTKEALKNRALQDAAEALTRRAAELRQSNEELTEFAMFASHDLQEPLRMVGSYTALLSARYMGKLDSDADEFIALALDGVQRMQRLIRDLLAYSRVGTQGMRMTDTPSGDALRLALRNLRGAIEESGARVTHDQLPRVMADELQICQLFQNLIGNAIKYQRPETPVVHVSADKNAGGKWEFSVRDNGIGIAPENFEQIFGMLRRLPGSEKISGTGIGLAICKRIVERHGGRISVESQPGIGSIFRFTLAGVSKRV